MTIKESCFLSSSTFATKNSECSSSKQEVVNEVQLGNYKRHVAEKHQIPPRTVLNWTKEACNPIPKKAKRYSPDFKQKVISEVGLGENYCKVARKYQIPSRTVWEWTIGIRKKAERYSPDFKQKVINEVCLGESQAYVAKKHQVPRAVVLGWTKGAPKIRIPKKAERYSPDFKRKVINEVCLGKSKAYVAKKYQVSPGTVLIWMKKAHLPVKPTPVIREPLEKETHPLEFKQKVVSEVCSGQHISQVCKNYNLYQSNLYIWLEQAYSPNFPYNSSAAWTDELNKTK